MKQIFLAFIFLLSSVYESINDAYAGLATLNSKWDKNEVNVCFAVKDHTETGIIFNEQDSSIHEIDPKTFGNWSEDLKLFLKNTIIETYTVERTGIKFIGWQDCNDRIEHSDVAIYISSEDVSNVQDSMRMTGQASLGMNGHLSMKIDKKAFVYFLHPKIIENDFKNADSEIKDLTNYIRALFIHEFGHLAGLAHEHDRDEIKDDVSCRKLMGEDFRHYEIASMYVYTATIEEYIEQFSNIEIFPAPPIKITKYDSVSIMNYCTLTAIQKGLIISSDLSVEDIATLKWMYAK